MYQLKSYWIITVYENIYVKSFQLKLFLLTIPQLEYWIHRSVHLELCRIWYIFFKYYPLQNYDTFT